MALALTFDQAAATAVAVNASEGDEALQRKLWLAIARHLIMATNNGAENDPVRTLPVSPELDRKLLYIIYACKACSG